MSEKPRAGGISTWTEGLKSNGFYFEGYVDDVDHLLENRQQLLPTAVKVEEQENVEVCTQ